MPRMTNAHGFALSIAIITIVLLATLAVSVLMLGFHQRRIVRTVTHRTQAYYFAQAGLVDARERIRRNQAPDNFTNNAFDPPQYSLDVDGNGVNDVLVDIGPEDALRLRPISVLGCDGLDPDPC